MPLNRKNKKKIATGTTAKPVVGDSTPPTTPQAPQPSAAVATTDLALTAERELEAALCNLKAERDQVASLTTPLVDAHSTVKAFHDKKYTAYTRTKALLDIFFNKANKVADRLAAMRELDKTISEIAKNYGVGAGGPAMAALLTGDWKDIAERAVIEKVLEGNLDAVKIAIASGKVSTLRSGDSEMPRTAVQINNNAWGDLTPDKARRLADMDAILLEDDSNPSEGTANAGT